MDYGFIAICISGTLFAFSVFDRIWGGGSRAAQSATKEFVNVEVAALRKDVFLKHDDTAGNVGAALQGLKDMAHSAEIEALKFRAYCAENYLRQAPLNDLKADVKDAFDKIDNRLERMEKTIAQNRLEDAGR